jgi:hypothetical protein
MYRSPFNFSSLRWHYPDQVIGVYSQILYLYLFSLSGYKLCFTKPPPLRNFCVIYIKSHASINQQKHNKCKHHIEEICRHESPR